MGSRAACGSVLSIAFFILTGCTPLGLNTARSDTNGLPPAAPPIIAAEQDSSLSPESWGEHRKAFLRGAFEAWVYGPVPSELRAVEIARRTVDEAYAGGLGILEEVEVRVGEGPHAPTFHIALATPRSVPPGMRSPLIVGENFCGNPTIAGAPSLSPQRTERGARRPEPSGRFSEQYSAGTFLKVPMRTFSGGDMPTPMSILASSWRIIRDERGAISKCSARFSQIAPPARRHSRLGRHLWMVTRRPRGGSAD